jgi:hypothetical protein
MIQYFSIQNASGAISRKYQIISVLSIVTRLIPIFYPLHRFLTVELNIASFFHTNVLNISKYDHFPSYLTTNYGPLKSEIVNVELVKYRYYKC